MNTTRKTLAVAAAWMACLAPVLAQAQTAPAVAPAAAAADMTTGEVRKVDADAGKLTLKHAEIKSLDMPPMTMVFAVRDKAVLARLKAGDKVRFKAADEGGKLTVTEIQTVP